MRPKLLRAAATTLPIAALLAISVPTNGAGAEPSARAHLFANLPDWTGFWETAEGVAFDRGIVPPTPQLWNKPPYTVEAQKKYAPDGFPMDGATNVFAVLPPKTSLTPQGGKSCQPTGFPTIMDMPVGDILFEFVVTPEQTLFVGVEGTIRHIYTDGRPHPDPADLWPTPVGDSIGHWEGQTLVVDTIAREPGAVGPGSGTANLSEQAHFIERLRRIDANTMEDAMTIEDPLRFTRPWRVTIRYARAQDVNRMIPVDCEHDRNTVGDDYGIAPP